MTKYLMTTAAALTLVAGAAYAQNVIDTAGVIVDTGGVTSTGSAITFGHVMADKDGYLVLHEVKDGKVVAPASVGHTAIKAGDNPTVTIDSAVPLDNGTQIVAMLHEETNGNTTYDFGEGSTEVDIPVMVDGAPVTAMVTIEPGMMKQ